MKETLKIRPYKVRTDVLNVNYYVYQETPYDLGYKID